MEKAGDPEMMWASGTQKRNEGFKSLCVEYQQTGV